MCKAFRAFQDPIAGGLGLYIGFLLQIPEKTSSRLKIGRRDDVGGVLVSLGYVFLGVFHDVTIVFLLKCLSAVRANLFVI